MPLLSSSQLLSVTLLALSALLVPPPRQEPPSPQVHQGPDEDGGAPPPPGEEDIRVATFNIRHGSARDGLDSWPLRRERLFAAIRVLDADILGAQEVESFQVRELLEALPRYGALGAHRDDGRLRGEGCTLLYDRTRFTVADSGTFWLSKTPEVPGSRSWDSSLPRIAVWARLLELESGRGLFAYSLHYDHRGEEARRQSSKVVLEHVEQEAASRWPGDPVVLLGDFNATLSTPALATYAEAGFQPAIPAAQERSGTFTGFDPQSTGGTRAIDHIFTLGGEGLSVRGAMVYRGRFNGRYPSDHLPVLADLRW